MKTKRVLVWASLAAFGLGGCKDEKPPKASPSVPALAPAPAAPSTERRAPSEPPLTQGSPSGIDVRTALTTALPEFRGIHIVSGEVGLERTLSKPWTDDELGAHLKPMGFVFGKYADTSVIAEKEPFILKRLGGTSLRLVVPMDDSMLPRMFQTQLPLASEALAALLPKAAADSHDVFVVSITYDATPARAEFLLKQLGDNHRAAGWVNLNRTGNDSTRLELFSPQLGGRIRIHRSAGRAEVVYRQPLRPRS